MRPLQKDLDPRLSASKTRPGQRREKKLPPIVIAVFLLALVMPPELWFDLGTLRLSPYRVILVFMLAPLLFRLLSGRYGRVNAVDMLIGLHIIWSAMAVFVVHGLGYGLEPAGIYMIEAGAAYLMARVYIRSADDFKATFRLAFTIILFLAPLAIIESVTGYNVIRNTFRALSGMPPIGHISPRMGLDRAFGTFDHPILFGVFAASIISTAFYVLGQARIRLKTVFFVGIAGLTTFLSLSTGPLFAMASQVVLIAWDRLTRKIPNRWLILSGIFALAWIFVSLVSTRDPIRVFIWYFAFSRESGYNRILIWEYGTAEVARHPIFGIGFGDWIRAPWMSSSMDNFWLVEAVRYGLPSLIFLVVAILILAIRMGRMEKLDEPVQRCRAAFLITIAGLALSGVTVHFWGALFCWFFFLIGSGVWMLEARPVQYSPREKQEKNTSRRLRGNRGYIPKDED